MDVIILLEERVRRFFDYGLHTELVLVLLDHCVGDTQRFLSGGEVFKAHPREAQDLRPHAWK